MPTLLVKGYVFRLDICFFIFILFVTHPFPQHCWQQSGISSTDTNGPFYVGGIPNGTYFSALRTTKKFVGCVRNFRFENQTQPLSAGNQFGDVNVNACPTN